MRLGLVLLAVVAAAAPAGATHDVDHRYVVLGYVRDAAGRPIQGRHVEVIREKTGLAYDTETDEAGFYAVAVHLHDEDLLDRLRVTAGPAMLRVQARFNPLNVRRPRGTRVDFGGGAAVEDQERFAVTFDEYVKR